MFHLLCSTLRRWVERTVKSDVKGHKGQDLTSLLIWIRESVYEIQRKFTESQYSTTENIK